MSDAKLGSIIRDEQRRDAVHIAITPVTADVQMHPGQHVGLVAGSMDKVEVSERPIGVVDPFLKRDVPAGQPFWLCLYPQTVTSLRHEWTHPDFAPQPMTPKEASKAWLTEIANACGVSYDRMINAIEEDDYIHMGENETYKRVLADIPDDEFRKHCEVVLGKSVNNLYPFSCSC